MSRIFGPVTQNGYVVADLEEAMRHWTQILGVGPFFALPNSTFQSHQYKGQKSSPEIRIALANSGDLQIELIQQVNDAPSPYVDFLKDGKPGLHHLSVWSRNYDADIARYDAMGLTRLSEGKLNDGPSFVYYDTSYHDGSVMEVLDLMTPPALELFEFVREAARDWDGSEPIRYIDLPG